METFDSIGEAIDSIVLFDREKFASMPLPVQTQLTALAGVGVSPVDRIVKTAEVLFAHRAKLTNPTRLLVARLIQYAAMNGWHGLNTDDRGKLIQRTMLADAKLDGQTIAAKDVPAPIAEFDLAKAAPIPDQPALPSG